MTRKTNASNAQAEQPQPPAPRARTNKIDQVAALLRRPNGATIEAMVAATGWQAHTVRGAMSGALKKKAGLFIASEKVDGVRTYRIVEEAAT